MYFLSLIHISKELRDRIEEEVSSIRLERDVFYPEHTVGFSIKKLLIPKVRLKAQLLSIDAVSYTHLDVYKRQGGTCSALRL